MVKEKRTRLETILYKSSMHNASLVLSICSFRADAYYSSDPFGTGFRRLYAHAQLKGTELQSSYVQQSLTQPNTSIQMMR